MAAAGSRDLEPPARARLQPVKAPPRNVMRIKIISMGDAGVGKSCLIKRYCEEKFVSKYISTIGVDFGVKAVSIDGIDVKVNFWDLAGPQEYFEVRNEFYRDAQGAILVYDVSKRSSFQALDTWLQEARKYGGQDITIAVVGNKGKIVEGESNSGTMTDSKKRDVKMQEGQKWASSNGFLFFETSANTGENVSELFSTLFLRTVRAARAQQR